MSKFRRKWCNAEDAELCAVNFCCTEDAQICAYKKTCCVGNPNSSTWLCVPLPTVAYDDVTSHFNLCSVKISYYSTCLYTLWWRLLTATAWIKSTIPMSLYCYGYSFSDIRCSTVPRSLSVLLEHCDSISTVLPTCPELTVYMRSQENGAF